MTIRALDDILSHMISDKDAQICNTANNWLRMGSLAEHTWNTERVFPNKFTVLLRIIQISLSDPLRLLSMIVVHAKRCAISSDRFCGGECFLVEYSSTFFLLSPLSFTLQAGRLCPNLIFDNKLFDMNLRKAEHRRQGAGFGNEHCMHAERLHSINKQGRTLRKPACLQSW